MTLSGVSRRRQAKSEHSAAAASPFTRKRTLGVRIRNADFLYERVAYMLEVDHSDRARGHKTVSRDRLRAYRERQPPVSGPALPISVTLPRVSAKLGEAQPTRAGEGRP